LLAYEDVVLFNGMAVVARDVANAIQSTKVRIVIVSCMQL
jgi:hypothetical protein